MRRADDTRADFFVGAEGVRDSMPEVAQRKTYTDTMDMTKMAPIKYLRNTETGTATQGPKNSDSAVLISGQKAHCARKIVCAEGDTVAGNIQSRGKPRAKM